MFSKWMIIQIATQMKEKNTKDVKLSFMRECSI